MRFLAPSLALALVGSGAARAAEPATPGPAPAAKIHTEAEAWKIGWPTLHGPHANFTPLRTGIRLVEHLKDARKVWESEYRDIGCGKFGDRPRGVIKSLNDPALHQGGFSTPIVAEGTVFVSHFRPSGDVIFPGEGDFAVLSDRARTVAADDVVAAIDAATGRTRWVAPQAGKGVNHVMGKRGGWGVSPAYYGGRVFAVGTTGRLYALDAATGRLDWETTVGPAHLEREQAKKDLLAKPRPPSLPAWNASLAVAGGVLVVPDYLGRDAGLRGVRPEDGTLLWEVKGASAHTATPSVVRLEGHEYILCATSAGELRLIAPRDGTVLWKVDGLGPNRRTLTPAGGYVMVNVRRPAADEGKVPGRLACYRLATTGAGKLWELPDKPEFGDHWWPDAGAHRHTLLRDGLVHLFFRAREGPEKDAARAEGHAVVQAETGRMLSYRRTERFMTMPYLVEDRLLYFGDLCHHPAWGTWSLIPERLPPDAPLPEAAGFDHLLTSGYEVQLEFPIVAGRIFMRTIEGRIACYDMRVTK